MSHWDNKTKLLVFETVHSPHPMAVKNRFASSQQPGAVPNLPNLLARLRSGAIGYDSIEISAEGVRRQDVSRLLLGTDAVAGQRDLGNHI